MSILVVTLTVFIICLAYIFRGLSRIFPWRRVLAVTVTLAAGVTLYSLYLRYSGRSGDGIVLSLSNLFLITIVAAVPFVIILTAGDLIRLSGWLLGRRSTKEAAIRRGKKTVLWTSAISLLLVVFMVDGILLGKYRFTVHEIPLEFENLPPEFDGIRIVQLSDLHLGSFGSNEQLKRAFDRVESLHPDIILMTGDIVNRDVTDMEPYLSELTSLSAPMGKFIVMGNHDYGIYRRDITETEREAMVEKLHHYFRETGFIFLSDQNYPLTRGADTLYLAGVENWGKPPFMAFGDLDKATRDIPQDGFTILMSHDPSHFERIVSTYPKEIALTLSGHTHGMQIGFELSQNVRWSPAALMYKHWAGLYKENGRYLYVNRGLGFHAFNGRAGIWPEITLLILKRKP